MGSDRVHLDAPQPAGASPDPNTSLLSTKSAQRAYLQSLDRSSRAWVLSSGKPHSSSVTLQPSEDTGSSIWYNPIPEEEDGGGAPAGAETWRRRDEMVESMTSKRTGQGDIGADGSEVADGWSSRRPEEVTDLGQRAEDSRGEDAGEKTCPLCHLQPQAAAHSSCSRVHRPTSDSSPTSQKKMIDRLRSPGTVRKLSLKMKKLPELRRKLSLRSSSRSNRQEPEGRGGEEATRRSTSQNVLSRYHLDSSTPPAPAQRRPSRGRSGRKGGEL